MKNLLTILIFAFLFQITGAETFKSHSTVMSVKDSTLQTKAMWRDWCKILPADGSHLEITVTKKKVIVGNMETYTLNSKAKPAHLAQVKHELAAIFVYNATDSKGQKWVITICRTDAIYAIMFENEQIMTVYQ
jgi:hypothetical protein